MADRKDDDDYDPYEHRSPAHPTNNFESWLHILKGILGTGILAMPNAFKYSGLFLGVVGSVVNGSLCTYGIHLLVRSQYLLCKRIKVGAQTYPESMMTACEIGPESMKNLKNYAKEITDGFLVSYQIGCCCVYVFFVAKNLKYVCDVFLPKSISTEMYMTMLFIPVFLVNSLRNLKVLVPFSMIANFITIVTIGAVFYFIFLGGFPPITDREFFANPYQLPLFFGTTNFAFQSVAIVSAVEYNMKTPKSFVGYFGIYNRAIALLMVIYTSLGFFGYWKYGKETEPSVTLNLPPNNTLTMVVNSLYAFAIFSSFGLNAYVPFQIIWDFYIGKSLKDTRWSVAWEYLIRLGIVVVSFVFPVTIPFLGAFISFLGSVIISCLVYIFPGWMDICARYPDKNYGCCKWRVWKDVLFMIYGFIGMLTGTTLSVMEIISDFQSGAHKK